MVGIKERLNLMSIEVQLQLLLREGWEVYCIGRNCEDRYWIEIIHVESGKLSRDLGLEIYHGHSIGEVISQANKAVAEQDPDQLNYHLTGQWK